LSDKVLQTGVSSLDNFIGGGIHFGVPTLVFGRTNIGKSVFCLQLAIKCCIDLKLPVLYIDTESMWTDPALNRWYSYFKNRWNLPDSLPIEFEGIPSIFKIFRYFGAELQIMATEKRQEALAKFPRRKPAKGEYTKTSIQTEDWLERSPVWKRLSEKKYGMLILDSITRPLKDVISKGTQHLPARGSALDPLLSAFLNIAVEKKMAVVITDHIVKSPMDKHPYGIPWGGDDISYYIKHIFGIYDPLKNMREQYGEFHKGSNMEARIFERHRFPGLLMDRLIIVLKKDLGYDNVPDYRSG